MKLIYGTLLALTLTSCAPATQEITGYKMTWSCNGNTRCINNMHAYYGSGDFTSETNCLVWETAFINNYYNATVTACTGHY